MYAGIQNSKFCYCGNYYDKYDKYGAADNCNMPCPKDNQTTCGGDHANQVYKISKLN